MDVIRPKTAFLIRLHMTIPLIECVEKGSKDTTDGAQNNFILASVFDMR